jgi:C-terminal processing protease CtpA/Prc
VLTEDLRSVTHDKHLRVEPHSPRGPGSEKRGNDGPPGGWHVIGETKRLDGDIAYIELVTFGVPRDQARDEVRDAMTEAADAKALIIDVRHNGGGFPETVALVSSYLFGAEPVHLNSMHWRVPARIVELYTDPGVAGTKFGPTKPVYVLTSAHTFSGAEGFTYHLQALKRATIVGETTGGGAHPGDLVALPHWFDVFVPSGQPIDPITKTNWEGTGVKPDVAVAEHAAFETARELALGSTSKR